MLISKFLARLDDSLAYMKADDIIVAISPPNGAWKLFAGIVLGNDDGTPVAVLSVGEGRYSSGDMSTTHLAATLRNFIQDHGDLEMAVDYDGHLHSRIDLNIDSDVDDDGYPSVMVAIIQAYIVKAAPRP